jgi:DNA invertase Pin-like site-specific DNA recombinase
MPDAKLLVPAAQYLRMSTEHQQYSFENQLSAIRRYAQERGFSIVRSYEDPAKTGLRLQNRPGLRAMLQDVVTRDAGFKAILVLDVSRWGRFQDIDESAYYEFLCKQSGAPVHYCSESFTNESTLVNMIVKSLKRSMAAEYSRELSAKVRTGTRRIASLGFRNGGAPGFGFRRMLVSSERIPIKILGVGNRKSLATDRVILVHGPAEEVACVREIFRLFVEERQSTAQIAEALNSGATFYPPNSPWYHEKVLRILKHPKYCGSHVLGQRSQILQGPSLAMPKNTWCVVPNAFEPIVSPKVFQDAQQILCCRTLFRTDEQILDSLRALWAREGRLSQKLIMEARDVPSLQAYRVRFGSLRGAYQLIGYSGRNSSLTFTETRQRMVAIKKSLVQEIAATFSEEVAIVQQNWRQRLRLRLRNRTIVSVHLCRGPLKRHDSMQWLLDTGRREVCKLSLVARLNENYAGFFDFHLMPCIRKPTRLLLKVDDAFLREGIKFTSVSEFLSVTKLLCDHSGD